MLGDREEFLVAFAGAGGEALHVARHPLDVLHQVDVGAVVEEAAPLRVEAAQVHVVVHGATGLGYRLLALALRGRLGGR